jgi:hypothetical protein
VASKVLRDHGMLRLARIVVCFTRAVAAVLCVTACESDLYKFLPPALAAANDTAEMRVALRPFIAHGDSIDGALLRLGNAGFLCETAAKSETPADAVQHQLTFHHCVAQRLERPQLAWLLFVVDSASRIRSFGISRNLPPSLRGQQ